MYNPNLSQNFTISDDLAFLSIPARNAEVAATTRADRYASMVHSANVQAGWWHDIETGEKLKRNFGELLMLVVSELSEAIQANEISAMDDKLPNHFGDATEIADALIRIGDICGAYATPECSLGTCVATMFGSGHIGRRIRHGTLTDNLMRVIVSLSNAMEKDRKGKPWMPDMAEAFLSLLLISRQRTMNVHLIVPEKMYFNAHRPDHKRENRLKEDGKKY